MKKIAIYGAGGFGREIHQLVDKINLKKKEWDLTGYYDDSISIGTKINTIPVLGGLKELNEIKESIFVVFAIASPSIVSSIVCEINTTFVSFPNLFHPDIEFEINYNQIGIGNIITQGCIFTRNISLGNFNIFNTRVCIGHDVTIGNFNVFQPNVQVSGNVTVGNNNYWGVNSCVLQNKRVGSFNLIGAGSLLIRNVKDSASYFGIPAIKIFTNN